MGLLTVSRIWVVGLGYGFFALGASFFGLLYRDVLKLCPGITGPATLKYRAEDEMLEAFVHRVRNGLNGLKCLMKDIEMIFATVLGRKVRFGGEKM